MSWEKKPLEQLGVITSSKRIYKKEYVKSGIPFFRTKEVKELANGKEIATELFISRERYLEILDKFGVPEEGDILLTAIGTIGEVYVVNNASPFYFKDGNVLWLKNFNELSPYYLRYALLSFVDELNALSNGAAYNALPINKLKQHQVFVPPKNIQNEIVTVLDKAFSDIDQVRANTEKNLQNARELFDSYLQQVFSERGDGWEELALQNAVSDDCSLSYGVVQPGEEFDGGIPVVRPVDLKKKSVEKSGLKRMDPKLADSYQRTSLSGSELLLCVRGETGTVAVSDPSLFGANVTRGIVPIKFSEEKVSLDFAYFQFLSPLINRQIKEKTYGTALKQINIRDLRQLSFFIPPIDKQYVIAEKLSEYQRAINKLESVYKSKLDALDELKQSLLQQAFTGQLTQG